MTGMCASGRTGGRFVLWCSGHVEAACACVALGLTMLPFTGLHGWLGGSGMAMLSVVGAQAEGAARASAGCGSMRT
eukprot:scaffold22296_cov166-Isochrysis_galbana.AAC.1